MTQAREAESQTNSLRYDLLLTSLTYTPEFLFFCGIEYNQRANRRLRPEEWHGNNEDGTLS
jgi:hypothetical protein